MNEPIAHLNGQTVPISQAVLSVFDLGVVAGAAVSEMVRTFRHQLFCLNEHLDRLEHSLDLLKMSCPLSRSELKAVCIEVARTNAAILDQTADLGLIVFVTTGQNVTYLGRSASKSNRPTVCVHTFPIQFDLYSEVYDRGLHLVIPAVKSMPDSVLPTAAKHRNRLHWHLADQHAKAIAADGNALLTDDEGFLTETAAGNLFVVEGKTILTPEQHILPGISRDQTVELAAQLGITVGHTRLTIEDLEKADEAFISSTPTCLVPVTRFQNHPVGNGQPGELFRKLMEQWNQRVGLDVIAQMKQRRE